MRNIRFVCILSLIFVLFFSILPFENMEEFHAAAHNKVKGYRCMYHIFRSFHYPHLLAQHFPVLKFGYDYT